ncbi:MAG: hypothetical protein L0Y72_20090 [Gemmataceae bacterium]|nr:hypothetical protein [Gemmataceae bacterium]MCI0741338.1 hypothetical protein [Gemmataceae bacterium]
MFRSLAVLLLCFAPMIARGEIPEPYRATVAKGLAWLAQVQHPDGHWEGTGGTYPVALTALAGMALRLEGSTVHEGAYSKNLRRAVDWLLDRTPRQPRYDGLIGDPENPTETGRYMFGHALALEFLALVYGDVADVELRKRIQDRLQRGVKFIEAAQTAQGGWYYVSSVDMGDRDASEGVVTVFVLAGLREARNAGIAVKRETLKKGFEYLQKSTAPNGGVNYTLGANGPADEGGRPVITAAALFLRLESSNPREPLVDKHLQFCWERIAAEPIVKTSELGHYFFAKPMWRLGDDGFAKILPDVPAKERLTWTRYRAALFDQLKRSQQKDGSWTSRGLGLGPVLVSSINLITLQQDLRGAPLGPR